MASAWGGMVSKPGSELMFIQLAAGQSQHQADNHLLRSIDLHPIQAEKEVHGLERDTLVPVDEGVVSRDPKPIGGGQSAEVRSRFIREPVSRPAEGGVQETPVPQPERSTMLPDLVSVHGEDYRLREPTGLLHFASSRMAFR